MADHHSAHLLLAESASPAHCVVTFGFNRVTDAGLAHLKSLTVLQTLDLRDCPEINDAGVAVLKEELPALAVRR